MMKSAVLNPVLRLVAKACLGSDVPILRNLSRVRVSGTVRLSAGEQRFTMFADWDDHIVDLLYFRPAEYSERRELLLFEAFARRSRCIVDAGANTGLYSIVAGKASSAELHAFEPYPVNFRRLQKNLALNGLAGRVRAVATALGDAERVIDLTVPTDGRICDVSSADGAFTRTHYREWLSYEDIEVPQVTLDGYCATHRLTGIDLIKLDVETYELSVLRGGVATLERDGPTLLAEIFVDDERRAFFEDVLRPLGYHAYSITPDGLLRSETLVENPDCGNVVLSPRRSAATHLPFSDVDAIADELLRPR